ncbi:MAG: hypothetical protein ACQEVA_03605 [Myxococcota bacterium]
MYTRPDASRAIISDERLAEIAEMGVPIYDGMNPPDMSGKYVFDSSEWIDAPREENVGRSVCDSEVTYTLEDDGTLSAESVYTACSGSGSSSGTQLSGEGSCYTTYARSQETFEGCERSSVSVSSGCLTEAGITYWTSAFFDTAHGEENCPALLEEGRLPPIDGVVVVEETDGLVEKIN